MEFSQLQTLASRPPGTLPDTTKDIYLLKTEVSDHNSKYISNPDILYITVTVYWLPDPSQGSGKYRHNVSITGAVKKNYAAAAGGVCHEASDAADSPGRRNHAGGAAGCLGFIRVTGHFSVDCADYVTVRFWPGQP
ncbi:hypothetical protein HMSSN139_64320 [Paenibacillus sp. HMSSN-139]|nr:hypothetical protein HMSSN139_64320 [Paenibacillus sp. HMSSN-139]